MYFYTFLYPNYSFNSYVDHTINQISSLIVDVETSLSDVMKDALKLEIVLDFGREDLPQI